MSNELFVIYIAIVLAVAVYGLVIFAMIRRGQLEYFRRHPELPNPFEHGHTPPAE